MHWQRATGIAQRQTHLAKVPPWSTPYVSLHNAISGEGKHPRVNRSSFQISTHVGSQLIASPLASLGKITESEFASCMGILCRSSCASTTSRRNIGLKAESPKIGFRVCTSLLLRSYFIATKQRLSGFYPVSREAAKVSSSPTHLMSSCKHN